MILYISSFIIFIFVAFNLFFRTDCSPVFKYLGTFIVFIASMKYVFYQYLGGAFFSPHMPRMLLIIMESLYGSLILLFFLLICWDIYLGGNWLLFKLNIPVPRHLPAGAIKSGLVILALGLGIYGTWESIRVPDVKTVEIKSEKLPGALNGFVIVQLSDLHIGPLLGKSWLEKVVEKTNALKPDIIALTGDYVDGTVGELIADLEPLSRLEAKYGIYGVTGNHEYYWNAAEWQVALRNFGIKILENAHEEVKRGEKSLVIAGLPDLAGMKFGHEIPDINKALANAPDTFRILLAHQPRNFKEYSSYVDLHLAGHTHGGLMFFIQPLIARFNSGFVKGLYSYNGSNLYVSPGTGLWNGFSSRVGVPAEITRFILKAI